MTKAQRRDRTALAAESQPATRVVALHLEQTVARGVEPATVAYSAQLLEALRASGRTPGRTAHRASRTVLRCLALATAAAAIAFAWLAPRAADQGAQAARSSVGRAPAATMAGPTLALAEQAPDDAPDAGTTLRAPRAQAVGRALPTPRVAAEHLARGRYAEALDAYRSLSRAQPERRAYAEIAAIIQRRLALRCEQRAELQEPACPDAER
jgi:hypothetical protein